MKYSKEIKEQALAMMETERTGIVSERMHIHSMTLQRWKREAAGVAQEEPAEIVIQESAEVSEQEVQMPESEQPQEADRLVAKRGRKKKQPVAPADPVVQAQLLLAEDGKESMVWIQQLEEDNERLRAENAQLREKCLRYWAALAALIN